MSCHDRARGPHPGSFDADGEGLHRPLRIHGIRRVVDVRTIPRSRHNPPFNRAQLSVSLHRARIHFRYFPEFGRFDHPRVDSINGAWRNPNFRGFADYMQTAEFLQNLECCLRLLREECTALMCSETVPWRCHRSLIADALLVRGVEVREITVPSRARTHSHTPWAKTRGPEVTYPASGDIGGSSGSLRSAQPTLAAARGSGSGAAEVPRQEHAARRRGGYPAAARCRGPPSARLWSRRGGRGGLSEGRARQSGGEYRSIDRATQGPRPLGRTDLSRP